MEGQEGQVSKQKPSHVELNERFGRTEQEFGHGRLLVRDVVPENKRDDVPLVSTLGFGTGNIALERTVAELYYSGEHVIEIDFLGGGKGVKGEKGSSSEYNRQGMLLADFMDKYFSENPHIERMDIMGQSSALFRVFALAKFRPDLLPRIRNVIFSSPAGFSEDDSHLELFKRFIEEDRRYKKSVSGPFDEENDANLKTAFNQTVLPYPIKAIKEINAIARANQYPTLEVLKAAGIKIGVLQGTEDKLVPNEKLWERIGKGYENPFVQGINPLTDQTNYAYEPQTAPPIDIVRMVKGGHGIQVDDPKKASKMILETIDHLNKTPDVL